MCRPRDREYGRLAIYFITMLCSCLPTSDSHCDDCRDATIIEEQAADCMPWFFANKSNPSSGCILFGHDFNEVVLRSNNISELRLGYCMTYDEKNNHTYMAACPYDIAKNHSPLVSSQHLRLNATLGGLNNFMCNQLNREGIHCARCKENYGQSIFTMDLTCHSCTRAYRGWGLYLFLEFTLLTCFLVALLLLRLSPTKPSLKSFVLFSQLIIVCLSLNYEPSYKHVYKSKAYVLVKIIKAVYGFWNLDFFRSLIPSFCVDDDLDNLEVIAFHYISVIYPTMLAAVAWIMVDLHERDCKLIVRIWKPFRRYLSHYSVTNDPKRIIVTFFASIIVLSYTKVIHISAQLLNVAKVYTVCGKSDTHNMFLQPDVQYFSIHHIPFVILASAMAFIFVVMPFLVLLLYPIGCIQDWLKSFCVRQKNIQMFVEVFQECYSDGSNETKDRRLFSVVYLFHRIVVVLILVKGMGNIAVYIIIAVLHGIVVGLLFGLKPYKQDSYNYLDILFFIIFALVFFFAAFAMHNANISDVIFSGIFLAMLVPFFYASIRVFVILIKLLKLINFKAIVQWRRRGYVEIGEYGFEQSVSEADVNHRRRMRERDSLQSE